MPGKADHQGENVFGDALCVGAGGIDDLDAAGGGGAHVDLIVADAVPPDDFELVTAIKKSRVHDSAGTDDERTRIDDLALQGRRIKCTRHAKFGRLPQYYQARFVHGGERK